MSEVLELVVASENELEEAAHKILKFTTGNTIFLLRAEMGAGKTTLIKAICKALKSEDKLSSPSYSIVNEYKYPNGKIFHLDLYRLKSEEELLDIGIETYLDSNQYCFIEWPELILNVIDSSFVTIQIDVRNKIRYIRAQKNV